MEQELLLQKKTVTYRMLETRMKATQTPRGLKPNGCSTCLVVVRLRSATGYGMLNLYQNAMKNLNRQPADLKANPAHLHRLHRRGVSQNLHPVLPNQKASLLPAAARKNLAHL